jgi:hypothetical protein
MKMGRRECAKPIRKNKLLNEQMEWRFESRNEIGKEI